MLQAASQADWQTAWEVFSASNPLPFSTAYLCRAECRHVCHPYKDTPAVDMSRVEQTAAERVMESSVPDLSAMLTQGPSRPDEIAPSPQRFGLDRFDRFDPDMPERGTRFSARPQPRESSAAVMDEPGARAAVVGSTPAALSAAYHLARGGYEVTVFSSEQSVGGWLQDAATGLRLPIGALQRDIARLRGMGIIFDELPAAAVDEYRNLRERDYDVVLVAPQMVNEERRAALVGDCFRGLVDANAFVRATKLHAVGLPDKIIVLGTGFDGVDAARVALAHGCDEVTLLLHTISHESPINSAEIRLVKEEGIRIRFCDFLQIKIARKQNGFEVVFPNTETRTEGQMILLDGAIMPYTADEGAMITLGPVRPSTMAIDIQTMLTETPGVFAIDPIRLANNSVTEEMAQGARAARIAREFVEGRSMDPALTPVWLSAQSSRKPCLTTGGAMPAIIAKTASRSAAQEAARCTNCSKTILIENAKCIGCLRCLESCFTGALYATDETGRPLLHPWRRKPAIHVDNGLCERCGGCVKLCPTKAISMQTLTLRHTEPELPVTTRRSKEETPTWEPFTEWTSEPER
jgi:ferredoxin/thioredoxin reductase